MMRLSAAGLAAAVLLAGCGGGSSPRASGDETPATTPATTPGAVTSSAAAPRTPARSAPPRTVPATSAPAAVTTSAAPPVRPSSQAPSGPAPAGDLSVTRASCSYVPAGFHDGRDALNIGVYVTLIGASSTDRLVSVAGTSDTGLSARLRTQANNRGETIVSFPLRSGDYGRTHVVTITVDADREVPETDESNNTVRITVTMPGPRPASAIDPLDCR